MNPDLNEQPRRSTWPWPVDTELDRARKIARMYRHHLRTSSPGTCAVLDETARGWDQGDWLIEKEDVVDPNQALTTAEAAELVRVTPKRIREWACANHPEKPGEPLLPRFKMRGRERTYLAVNVLAAAAAMRRYRHAHGGD